MALTALDNLVRIGQLKAEPRNTAEVQRMLAMAQTRWADAQLDHVSQEGRFTSAYNAAHVAALAALRWHGATVRGLVIWDRDDPMVSVAVAPDGDA